MPVIKVRNESVNVDIKTELEAFEWTRPRWTYDKLIAASPFRYDNTPSFFVNLETGGWADSGHYDAEYANGNFVKLLAFLRNETAEETEDYLLDAYGFGNSVERARLIVPELRERKPFRPLDESLIEPAVSPYLLSRGISEEVQRMVGVGRSRYNGFVAIPWRLPDGRLANIKYRATRGKTFFYEAGAFPIRQAVWGADLVDYTALVPAQKDAPIVVCEAEIDAMSWLTAGIKAVAIGGVAFNAKQRDIIRSLPFRSIIVAGDNDKAGKRFNESVVTALGNSVQLSLLNWGKLAEKDANDILRKYGSDALRELAVNSTKVPMFRHLSNDSTAK